MSATAAAVVSRFEYEYRRAHGIEFRTRPFDVTHFPMKNGAPEFEVGEDPMKPWAT